MWHAVRMIRVILSAVPCLALPHFSTLMVQFSEQMLFNMKCVFLLSVQLLSGTFLILIITERDITVHVHRSSCYDMIWYGICYDVMCYGMM